eukprot:gene7838-5639_t
MGLAASRTDTWEQPAEKYQATLYYFGGRGLADQIRWMLAATDVSFTQKLISQRDQIVRMSDAQLPFGQLPLLQIDGLELVQSQAIVRYLARRAGLQGLTADEVVKCDMIAEAVRDLLSLVTSAPFKRKYYQPVQHLQHDASDPAWQAYLTLLKTKWAFLGQRFEAILRSNRMQLAQQQKRQASTDRSSGGSSSSSSSSGATAAAGAAGAAPSSTVAVHYMVGSALTYADILVAHVTTWYVEECGPEIVAQMPLVVALQNAVISLPGVTKFIKSIHYFPLGDRAYCEQVDRVLGRKVT